MTPPRVPGVAPQGGDRWRAATAPQTLVAGFVLVLALVYALHAATRPGVAPPPTLPAFGADAGAMVTREVRYVVVDALGLERPAFADVDLPGDHADDAGTRLTAALAALRADLGTGGGWPPGVGPPAAFVIELERRVLAVVDVAAPGPDARVDVGRELAALRSLVATARVEAGADVVLVTVNGQPATSLWGQVALRAEGF